MTKLDDLALNIELVLVSIIESLALDEISANATPFLTSLHGLAYLPYILAGLAIILVFWAQAILHAISFIRWPLRMEHMFLYFIAVFLQVQAFSSIGDSAQWFFWWTMFSLLIFLTYVIDLRIIRQMKPRFEAEGAGAYIAHVERRHARELRSLVPLAIAFNAVAWILTLIFPAFFEQQLSIAGLGALQFLTTMSSLVDCVRNFRARSDEVAQMMLS